MPFAPSLKAWTETSLTSPYISLATLFATWKFVLLTVALLSPGSSYDTSTSLILQLREDAHLQKSTAGSSLGGWRHRLGETLANRLVRWDAIYFSTIAQRGYQHEQEWAFGYGFTRVVAVLTDCKNDWTIS